MRVYFVRHGVTQLGKDRKFQYPDTPLSDEGLLQSRQIANRLKDLQFDLLISSPYRRALQTAQAINENHNKEIIQSDLFVETKPPSEQMDLKRTSSEFKEISTEFSAATHDPHWRYSDEENFFEIRTRAEEAIQYLEHINKDTVVVTLHGNILRVIVSVMEHGPDVTPELFYRFCDFAPTFNTGVTQCNFDEENGWRLISWNDHSHLG